MSIHLILGGARSGKSRRAEELATQSNLPVIYLSTYLLDEADAEMVARVEAHRKRRPAEWGNVEGGFQLENVFREHREHCVLLDCLTMWLAYWMTMRGESVQEVLARLENDLKEPPCELLVVSNEVGMGLVPEDAISRSFRDLQGWANQLVARYSNRVEWMAAGIPMVLKG